MGNCFSDPSKPPGKGQRLGSGTGTTNSPAGSTSRPPRPQAPASPTSPQTAGGSGSSGSPTSGDPRTSALAAAEARAKAAAGKGVSTSNPKAGQLSAKLDAQPRRTSGQQQGNERLMDAGQWN